MVDVVRAHTRQLIAALAVAAMAAAAAGCKSSSSGGAERAAFPATTLSWVRGKAEVADGTAPKFTVASACGSPTDTYLAELLHTSPGEAKVLHEWGDIVPGGKEIMISGSVTHAHLGPFDLPMSHPYGYDLSLDVRLDPPFQPFSKNLGPVEVPDVEMHTEISSGLLPHAATAAGVPPVATWADQSDRNMTGFLPGFEGPAVGDRITVMGRWVIDCGHDNFQTELHPMTFLAWSHDDGTTTTTHIVYNPYRDTETYSPDASILGRVDDATRLKRQDSRPFPQFLAAQVLGLVTGGGDRLHSQELIEATHASPAPLAVCAPGAAKSATVSFDLVARPGVDTTVAQEKGKTCAIVTVKLGKDYKPLDAPLHQCPLPWSYLNTVARQAVGGNVDVQALLNENVPAFVRNRVAADPDTTCADALTAPPVDASSGHGPVRTNADQPFPVYGVIRVAATG